MPGPPPEGTSGVVQLATDERQVERQVVDGGGDRPRVARRARDPGEVGGGDDEPVAREVWREVVVVEARAAQAVRDQDEWVRPRKRLGLPTRATSGIPDLGRQRPTPAVRIDRVDGRDADGEHSRASRIRRADRGRREREPEESPHGATTHALVLPFLVRVIQPRGWESGPLAAAQLVYAAHQTPARMATTAKKPTIGSMRAT